MLQYLLRLFDVSDSDNEDIHPIFNVTVDRANDSNIAEVEIGPVEKNTEYVVQYIAIIPAGTDRTL